MSLEMFVSKREKRVQHLLRLAELCSTDEDERRLRYMDEVEKIMFADTEDISILTNEELQEKRHPSIYYFNEYINKKDFNFEKVGVREIYNLYLNYCLNVNEKPEPIQRVTKYITYANNLKSQTVYKDGSYFRGFRYIK